MEVLSRLPPSGRPAGAASVTNLMDCPIDLRNRVEYEMLSPVDEALICAWLLYHGIEPKRTPQYAEIEYDAEHDEWRVEQWRIGEDGGPVVTDSGDLVTFIRRVRRRGTALPWPTWGQLIDELWEWVTDPGP